SLYPSWPSRADPSQAMLAPNLSPRTGLIGRERVSPFHLFYSYGSMHSRRSFFGLLTRLSGANALGRCGGRGLGLVGLLRYHLQLQGFARGRVGCRRIREELKEFVSVQAELLQPLPDQAQVPDGKGLVIRTGGDQPGAIRAETGRVIPHRFGAGQPDHL